MVTNMTEPEKREALRRAIITAFDKWGANWFDSLFTSMSNGFKPDELKAFYYDDLFMSKRALIPGFMRHVTQQVSRNEDCKRRRMALIEACLYSILHPTGTTITELEKSSQSDTEYTRRHLQRLVHESFPEMFIEVPEQRDDRRFSYFSSVFSPYEAPKLLNPEDVGRAQLQDVVAALSHPRHMQRILLNGTINLVAPEMLESLIKFREEALEIMSKTGYDSEYGRVLFADLKEVTDILLIFHAHFQSMLAVSWFRGRRLETKKELMKRGFPLSYSKDDAEAARRLLLVVSHRGIYIVHNAAWSFSISSV